MNKFLDILIVLLWIFNFYLYGELNYLWGQNHALHGNSYNHILKNSKEVQDSINVIPSLFKMVNLLDSLVNK